MPLGGAFNVANTLAAATTAEVLGVGLDAIGAGLAAAGGVPGRFERVRDGRDEFTVIVDYAHTPDGLAEVIAAAREVADGAGHRRLRRRWRPRPREAAAHGCRRRRRRRPCVRDVRQPALGGSARRSSPPCSVVWTRTTVAACAVEADRAAAIALAIDAAAPGDVVLIAGKGHETTQTIGDRSSPFDDRAVARRAPGGARA